MSLFARARAFANLTPSERALLKLIEGLFFAALVAALPIIADALSRNAVNWSDVGRTTLAAGSVAALLALSKYLKAHGDPALAAVASDVAADVQAGKAPNQIASDVARDAAQIVAQAKQANDAITTAAQANTALDTVAKAAAAPAK